MRGKRRLMVEKDEGRKVKMKKEATVWKTKGREGRKGGKGRYIDEKKKGK